MIEPVVPGLRMGKYGHSWSGLGERVAGKWQIPLLFVAVSALALAVVTYRSPTSKIPFDDLKAKLPALIDRGQYTAAIEMADLLLQVPKKTDLERAAIQAAMGQALALRAEQNDFSSAEIGRRVVEAFQRATEGEYELTAADYAHLGKAHDWTGDAVGAVELYEKHVQQTGEADVNLVKRVIELNIDYLRAPVAKFTDALGALIARAQDRPEVLVWAAERKIDALCDANRCGEAEGVASELAEHVQERPWSDWSAYLRAYAAYRNGQYDEAERELRVLRDGLSLRDELYARSGWLLGRAVLWDEGPKRPAEAIAIFEDALSSKASEIDAAAAEVGLAEALVMLERYDEGLMHYDEALRRLGRVGPTYRVNRGAVELSLTLTSERLKREGHLMRGLRFAERAADLATADDTVRTTFLLGRLAELKAVVAERMRAVADGLFRGAEFDADSAAVVLGDTFPSTDEERQGRAQELRADSRRLLLESGGLYERMAALWTMEEERAAEAAWLSVERTYESGDYAAAADAVDRFMFERPESPKGPRALRLKGQALQALGRYGEAVEVFQENQRSFPRTPDAGSSLIPLARCFLAMGKKYAEQAEKTLRIILDDSEVFTPAAPEFADALFLLGELLNRSGEYERAIPVLEEAMARYARDERTARAQFLLGDSYLQSGLAMEEAIGAARVSAERERLAAERRRRLQRAAELFGTMVEEYESGEAGALSVLDEVYLRHARLYHADCLFELGEYQQSLGHYERAAWIYKSTTTALAAYVQIINCHVFTGNQAEAAAALRRAQYLVETLPDEAFETGVDLESRADWKRYFDWVGESGVL